MGCRKLQDSWPGGWLAGDEVEFKGRRGRVAAVPLELAEDEYGSVPVTFADEPKASVFIPADDLPKPNKK